MIIRFNRLATILVHLILAAYSYSTVSAQTPRRVTMILDGTTVTVPILPGYGNACEAAPVICQEASMGYKDQLVDAMIYSDRVLSNPDNFTPDEVFFIVAHKKDLKATIPTRDHLKLIENTMTSAASPKGKAKLDDRRLEEVNQLLTENDLADPISEIRYDAPIVVSKSDKHVSILMVFEPTINGRKLKAVAIANHFVMKNRSFIVYTNMSPSNDVDLYKIISTNAAMVSLLLGPR